MRSAAVIPPLHPAAPKTSTRREHGDNRGGAARRSSRAAAGQGGSGRGRRGGPRVVRHGRVRRLRARLHLPDRPLPQPQRRAVPQAEGGDLRQRRGAAHGGVAAERRQRARRSQRPGRRLGHLLLQALLWRVPSRAAGVPCAGAHDERDGAPPLRRGRLREAPRRLLDARGREPAAHPTV